MALMRGPISGLTIVPLRKKDDVLHGKRAKVLSLMSSRLLTGAIRGGSGCFEKVCVGAERDFGDDA